MRHAGCSGLVVSTSDCSMRGHSIEPILQTISVFFTKVSVIHSFGHGSTPILQCLGRLSLPPSV